VADAPLLGLALGSSGIPSSCLSAPSDSQRILSLSERKVQVPTSRALGGTPVPYSRVGGGLGPSHSSILGRPPQTGPRSKRPGEEITEQPPSKWQKLRENQRAAGSEQNLSLMMLDSHEQLVSFAMPKQQPPTIQTIQQKPVMPPPNPSSSSSSAVFNQSPAAKAVRIPGWARSEGSAAMGPSKGPKKTAASSVMGAPTGPKNAAPTGPKSAKRR
jgi:hypothetical protein